MFDCFAQNATKSIQMGSKPGKTVKKAPKSAEKRSKRPQRCRTACCGFRIRQKKSCPISTVFVKIANKKMKRVRKHLERRKKHQKRPRNGRIRPKAVAGAESAVPNLRCRNTVFRKVVRFLSFLKRSDPGDPFGLGEHQIAEKSSETGAERAETVPAASVGRIYRKKRSCPISLVFSRFSIGRPSWVGKWSERTKKCKKRSRNGRKPTQNARFPSKTARSRNPATAPGRPNFAVPRPTRVAGVIAAQNVTLSPGWLAAGPPLRGVPNDPSETARVSSRLNFSRFKNQLRGLEH